MGEVGDDGVESDLRFCLSVDGGGDEEVKVDCILMMRGRVTVG